MKRPFLKTLSGKFASRTALLTLLVSLLVGALAIFVAEGAVGMAIVVVVALLGALVAGYLASNFADQVTAPIVTLRAAAVQSAAILPAIAEASASGEEVPELPIIRLNSGDEVEDLAMSFSEMQHTAAELALTQAQEQADTEQHNGERFVNLGRRTQNLLARQMSFIDEMEKDERNPANLQRLFQIDHLATRMRRNAESILVLADTPSPRRLRKSVSMHQVVQAASSEIEHFDRIAIADISGASVDGSAATDIAHLLAELLENATSFSSPEATTTVSGRKTDQGYLLEIADRGIGMQPDAMAAANARFADPTGELDAQHSSAFLGHDVVARLARRHNVAVELSATVAGGVTARLHIPDSALAAAGQASAPAANAEVPTQPVATEPAPAQPAPTEPAPQAAAAASVPAVDAPAVQAPIVDAPAVPAVEAPVAAVSGPSPMTAEEFAATQYEAPLVEAGLGDTTFADLVPADASSLVDLPAPEAAPTAFTSESVDAPAPVAEPTPDTTAMPVRPVAEEASASPAVAGPSELADDGWVERGLTSEQRAAIDWAISKGGSVSGVSDLGRGLAGVAPAAEVRPGPIDAATIAELGGTTPSGFKRRRRGEEGAAVFADPSTQSEPRATTGPRSPDQLMAFRKGIENGRAEAAAAAQSETNYAGEL